MKSPISANLIAVLCYPFVTIGIWQQMDQSIYAQSTPECFMVSEGGKTVDLSQICLSSTSLSTQIEAGNRQIQPENSLESIPDVQVDDIPQFTQDILRGTAAVAELDSIVQRTNVPDYLVGTIDQQTYENRPKCQLQVETLGDNISSPDINLPTIQ